MKKQLLIATLAMMACAGSIFAVPHSLKEHGMVEEVTHVYTSAENPDTLAPIIKTYYERIQQRQFDIPVQDLEALHEELCKIMAKDSKVQL